VIIDVLFSFNLAAILDFFLMVGQKFCSTSTNRQVDVPNHGVVKEIELIQDGGHIKREKDIYHHGPGPKPIICPRPDPPTFSLPTTFKKQWRFKLLEAPVIKCIFLSNFPCRLVFAKCKNYR
jgi:hypothetical protein